jgi:hypothetical protein
MRVVPVMAVVMTCGKRWRSGREHHDSKEGKRDLLHALIHSVQL